MQNIKTLTVYLGSSGHARPVFKDSAIALGKMIAEHEYDLVYGGMDAGLMGLLAQSCLKNGGNVTGIVPQKLKDSERILGGLNDTILVDDLWDRKKRMFQMADAILALPGGFGTLDESLEVLYWGSLKLHNKPLVLINIENYWDPLITYLNTLKDFDPRYLIVVNTIEEIEPALAAWTPITIPPDAKHHFPHFEDEITQKTNQPIIIDQLSVKSAYYAACALGLKQLGKHKRAIGFHNQNKQFAALINWINAAAQETFITQDCLRLFISGEDITELRENLNTQQYVEIDLHEKKWGAPV